MKEERKREKKTYITHQKGKKDERKGNTIYIVQLLPNIAGQFLRSVHICTMVGCDLKVAGVPSSPARLSTASSRAVSWAE